MKKTNSSCRYLLDLYVFSCCFFKRYRDPIKINQENMKNISSCYIDKRKKKK